MKQETGARPPRGNSPEPAAASAGPSPPSGEEVGTHSDDTLGPALASCLDRLAAGDLSARDTVIELVSGRLRTLAHRMLFRFPNVRRWEETDDLFQNAALRLHRSLGQMRLTDARAVMAVAATEVHRELLDLARKHAGPMSYAANHGTNVIRGSRDPEAAARHVDLASVTDGGTDRWSAFHEAIHSLDPEHREIFQLVWYLGCDQKTIAATLGCSERTVKSRWREAREAVRAKLDGESPA